MGGLGLREAVEMGPLELGGAAARREGSDFQGESPEGGFRVSQAPRGREEGTRFVWVCFPWERASYQHPMGSSCP